jgi:hypothetical protein
VEGAADAHQSAVKPKNPALAGLFGERWRRTQRIRTAAAIPVEAVIVDQAVEPVYLRIAETARHLQELGMSNRAIAEALGVSDKTVAKSEALGLEDSRDERVRPHRVARTRHGGGSTAAP